MSYLPVGDSARRLAESVRKLESTLRSAGMPRWMARLPVCWLCWHYCRLLDQKIARIRRVENKFQRWRVALTQALERVELERELIDLDRSMRNDIELTKNSMWDLRGYCIDIGRMFEQLGYQSDGLKRRQALFLQVLEASCASASRMQEALTLHDESVLAILRAEAAARA